MHSLQLYCSRCPLLIVPSCPSCLSCDGLLTALHSHVHSSNIVTNVLKCCRLFTDSLCCTLGLPIVQGSALHWVSELELRHVVLQADICCVHIVMSYIRSSVYNMKNYGCIWQILVKWWCTGNYREGIYVVGMKEFKC